MKKYSYWSNLKFAYSPVWQEKRSYIWEMLLEILFAVVIPLMGSAMSAWVIALLGNQKSVLFIVLGILLAFLGYAIANAFYTYMTQKHSARHVELRTQIFTMQIFQKVLRIPLELSEKPEIRLSYEKAFMAIYGNWTGIEGFFRYGTQLGVGLLGLVVYSCIATSLHPLVCILLIGLSVISAWVNYLPRWYENKIKDQVAREKITMKYIDQVTDQVACGKDIRLFGLKKWLIGKYDQAILTIRKLNAKRNRFAFLGQATTLTLDAGRDLVCYLYLIDLLQAGMSVAEFVFYLGIIGEFSKWFNEVSQNLVQMRSCSIQMSDLRTYLDVPEETNKEMRMPDNQFKRIEVVFDHVTYIYPGATKPTLKGVSFSLKAGEHKALVGLNGAGKSTLVKLICGLYLPTSGQVRVNGIDTRKLNLTEYYKHQAAIFQEAFTLAYSIGENIALSSKWEEECVLECIELAGLGKKIKALPEGLNTHLGKDLSASGIQFSGGETQKLLLARALYRNPSLILLDEPTAALDALAEAQIYEIYDQSLRDMTSLFISHRLASTKFCEEIILLDEGRIIEQGSHEALMEAKGKYYELFKVQSQYYEEGEQ